MELKSVEKVWSGKFVSMYVCEYINREGGIKKYELLSRNHNLTVENFKPSDAAGVVIICFNEDKSKILVEREYRLSSNSWVYNFPGGLIDPGEDAKIASARELKEETGLDCIGVDNILPPSVSAIGISDEVLQVVFMKATGKIVPSSFLDEEIEALWLTKKEALELINSKAILCARLQMVLWMWINE